MIILNVNYLFSYLLHKCQGDGGSRGNGMSKGTCDGDNMCQADGTCALCAVSNTFPHTGCTVLNPLCSGGACKCTTSTTCSSDTSSVCENPAADGSSGSCKCGLAANSGSDVACSGTTPKCTGNGNSATCQVGFSAICSFNG